MKLAALSLTFAFSSVSLVAQSAPSAGYTTYRFGAVSNGCPVSMKLDQTLSHQVQTVQNGVVMKMPATQLTLTVGLPLPSGAVVGGMQPVQENTQPAAPSRPARVPARIAFATATVHGFGTGAQFELISPGVGRSQRGNRSPAPQKNLKLQFNSKDGSSVADMWLPGFGPVRWLDLDTITYTDGTTWKPTRGESCTVTPSLLMLVGADSAAPAKP